LVITSRPPMLTLTIGSQMLARHDVLHNLVHRCRLGRIDRYRRHRLGAGQPGMLGSADRRSGYSVEDYQAWVEDTLAAALLHPSLLKG
jgi:hypothetical protein